MTTVTKKATENTTERDIREILETSDEVTFTISDFENYTTAMCFTGFEACTYRAKSFYLINLASRLMVDDDYTVEVKNLDSWTQFYTITKKA